MWGGCDRGEPIAIAELKPLTDQELVCLCRLLVFLNPANMEHFKKIRPNDWKLIEHLVIEKKDNKP